MSSRTVRLTLHFTHGETLAIDADADDTRLRNLAGNIEQAMAANYVGIELDGTLRLFPLHGIREIEIAPAPAMPIQHVVRNVRRA